ncbi:metallophosphoesterase [Parabacteroides sp. PF5-6]|uniref:metallophosphoesterase n=1 Tax=Parabacteroides sp. PF5-6 TaxID=1742403 RepID=UPI002405BE6C|nr:metallophosphoesterase [Parabacteroides sp. PF5-6]MDF9830359.1 putative MPP superfamily phosphohydrolase [Parabacteroides sp. PF5-6]
MRLIPVLLMLTVILGGNYYVFLRLWQMLPPSLVGRLLFVVAAVFLIASPFVSMLAGSAFPPTLTAAMYRIGTSWLIAFMYLLLAFLVLDIIRLTHLFPIDTYLRHSWIGLGTLAAGLTILLSIGYYRYTHKDRVELQLSVDKEIAGELKIVAASDLHLGYGIGRKEFESWVELINKENPDIVLIAGDITDNNVAPLYEADMGAVFSQIKSRYGTYVIPGNHEYIAGGEPAETFLRAAGVTFLKDSVALVDDRFYIVGRDDRSNPQRQTIAALTASLDPSKPIILLDHQPYHLEEAEQSGIDLQLSGHTHKGQVWPISLVTRFLFELDHGYKQKSNTHYYVSSGLGIWGGKFRIGSRSEYVVIRFKGKSSR